MLSLGTNDRVQGFHCSGQSEAHTPAPAAGQGVGKEEQKKCAKIQIKFSPLQTTFKIKNNSFLGLRRENTEKRNEPYVSMSFKTLFFHDFLFVFAPGSKFNVACPNLPGLIS